MLQVGAIEEEEEEEEEEGNGQFNATGQRTIHTGPTFVTSNATERHLPL
jgi:hypothetical protein